MSGTVNGFETGAVVTRPLPEGFDAPDLPPAGWLEQVRERRRTVNRLAAQDVVALTEVHRLRGEQYRARAADLDQDQRFVFVDDWDALNAEVGAALGVTRAAAAGELDRAVDLRERLPGVLALMGDGLVSMRQARIVLTQSAAITDPDLVAQFDTRITAVLAGRLSRPGAVLGPRAVESAAARIVARLDLDAHRHRPAGRKDYLAFTAHHDGKVTMEARMDRAAAVDISQMVEQVAATVCRKDGRSRDQREVDAVHSLMQGYASLGCRCGRDTCEHAERRPRTGAVTERVKADLVLVLAESTLAGADDRPGELLGATRCASGPVTATEARRLLDTCTVTVRTVGRRAADGTVTAPEATGYRPTATQHLVVRLRYRTCVFPGCQVPAEHCQLDHVIEYNHTDPTQGGRTVVGNLVPLCGFHHRIKTHTGWLSDVLPDGTVHWHHPAGPTYLTGLVQGTDGFPTIEQLVWEPARDVPEPTPKPTDSTPSRAEQRNAHRERLRQHNRRLRHADDTRHGREPDQPPPF